MGAAQGDLAGGEIIEQGSCALYLCEVEFAMKDIEIDSDKATECA
jgi:hypothetical protein